MTEEKITQIELAKLELKDGDILVIKPQSRILSPAAAEELEDRFRERFKRIFPIDIGFIILTEPVDLTILCPESE